MTQIINVDLKKYDKQSLRVAADSLKNGHTVVFPTETVYGIGASVFSKDGIEAIFKAKGRPSDNPLIVHISSKDMVYDLVDEVSSLAKELMDRFWPGPLTIIFKKSDIVPLEVTAGLSTVAIRMPKHRIAKDLIEMSGVPVAAPSANISGRPSGTNFRHVKQDLMGKVDYIIEADNSEIGLESTVVDISGDTITILRPGAITIDDFKEITQNVKIDPAIVHMNSDIIPKSPGMKYTHYSPRAEVILVRGDMDCVVRKINELSKKHKTMGKNIGVMSSDEYSDMYDANSIISIGTRSNMLSIASNLFKALREFDEIGVDIIFVEAFSEDGIGLAVMNRLMKACGGNIVQA